MRQKPSLLLHACCAPCSPYIIQHLSGEYDLMLYFYNPNIHPHSEYMLRLNEIERLASDLNQPLTIGRQDTAEWFDFIRGYEDEPERGERCRHCFEFRLEAACRTAAANGITTVTTTLTISPHKSASDINRIGTELSHKYDIVFLAENFKKNDGYKKTIETGRKYNFYRQNYCGCAFSRRT